MLQRAVEKEYVYREKRYSITSLLDPDRVLILKRRHNDEIEQDVSECIWMLFGTVTHYVLETGIELKENEFVEEHLDYTFDNGYTSAIRPVFTLKSEIKVTGGDGVDTPYTLAP